MLFRSRLSELSSHYIIPEYESVKKFSNHKRINELNDGNQTTKPQHLPPIIVHTSLIYPSLKLSYGILKRNRVTYKKIMHNLNKLEKEKVSGTYKSVMENKSKLEYFRIHSKKTLDNGNISYHHRFFSNQKNPYFD